ncbi:hypothetical protein LLE49_20155 [Alicyclobacillus tolerans]|uniref:hypothetical protein n=1 Tax=Alicyclobacillus tolerans TaxID=90970 RepID=UPI001F3EBB95|nr:hypothetical protein [Alicyclobacillus tolerans]MCF8567038.1 hypothetical protein [Alicyclobacillus tolerans]
MSNSYQGLSSALAQGPSTSAGTSSGTSSVLSSPYATGRFGSVPGTRSSTTQTTPTPTTPNISNGGFLDFLITVIAMILVLQSHKIVKSFLDHLFPGGGGHGPGALVSGLMEGAGMAVGKSLFRGGKGMVKTGVGMTGAAAMGGLAAAHKYAKENGSVFGSEGGILGGMKQRITPDLKALNPPDIQALPPDQGPRMDGPKGFTMGGGAAPGTGTESNAGMSGSSSTGMGSTSSMSFGPGMNSTGTSGTSSGTSGLFDAQSLRHGAHTQLRPSAQSKVEELGKLNASKTPGGLVGAFAQGAKERFTADAKHKLTGQKGYAGGAHSWLGVAAQEFGGQREQDAEHQMIRDSYLPSKQLMDAAEKSDPLALSDLGQVGQHQGLMEEGLQWIEQGQTLQRALQPEYVRAKVEYDQSHQEVEGLGMILDGYRANGQTNTPAFQQVQSQYDVALGRHQSAEEQFGIRKSQMTQAQNRTARGEQRVVTSQNAIAKINMGWYAERERRSPRMVQVAQARAQRKGLSDLGQAPYAKRERRT